MYLHPYLSDKTTIWVRPHHEEHEDHRQRHDSEKFLPVLDENVHEGGEQRDDGDDEDYFDDEKTRRENFDQFGVGSFSTNETRSPAIGNL